MGERQRENYKTISLVNIYTQKSLTNTNKQNSAIHRNKYAIFPRPLQYLKINQCNPRYYHTKEER